MSEGIWLALIGLFSGGFGSLLTHYLSKRKNKAEANSIELDNAQKVIKILREELDQQEEKIANQEALIESQQKQIEKLSIKIDDLINDMRTIKANHEELCATCIYRQFYLDNKK
jgi:uncharacterized protein HemX